MKRNYRLFIVCSIDGCEEKHSCKGFCKSHYSRFYWHGNPLSGRIGNGEPTRWLMDNSSYEGEECLKWPFGYSKSGYGAYKGKYGETPHREMCAIVNGPPPAEGKWVAAHNCGNGKNGCVNPKHLRWATYEENERDKIRHGNGRMGLKEEDIRQIRRLYGEKNFGEISEIFGISRRTVSNIIKGKSLAWVE